jgi:hypothetical protein
MRPEDLASHLKDAVAKYRKHCHTHAELDKALVESHELEVIARNNFVIAENAIENIAHISNVNETLASTVKTALDRLKHDVLKEYSKAQVKLQEEKERVSALMKEWQPVADLMLSTNVSVCPICIDSNADSFFIPCGHTLCRECALRNNGTCFMCKAYVGSTLGRLF